MTVKRDRYRVMDTPFNRSWYWSLIGQEFINPPAYVQVTKVRENVEDNVMLLSEVSRALGLAKSLAEPMFPLTESRPGSIEEIAQEIVDTLEKVIHEMLGPTQEQINRYMGDGNAV